MLEVQQKAQRRQSVAHVVSLAVGSSLGDRALRHDLGHWGVLSDGWQLVSATFDPLVAPTALRLND
jgi:hypothetical protein